MSAVEDRTVSATDLARAWEAVPDLRRRAHQLQLVSKLSDSCSDPMKIMVCIWGHFQGWAAKKKELIIFEGANFDTVLYFANPWVHDTVHVNRFADILGHLHSGE